MGVEVPEAVEVEVAGAAELVSAVVLVAGWGLAGKRLTGALSELVGAELAEVAPESEVVDDFAGRGGVAALAS